MLESLVATLAALLAGAISGLIMHALGGDTTTSLWAASVVSVALVTAWIWFYIRASHPRLHDHILRRGTSSNAR